MNIVEYYRKKAIDNIFNVTSFQNAWNVWQPEINTILGQELTANNILNLGDRLSDIFSTTRQSGRNQSSLSAGGTVWEALVCWYINLCTVNSRIVAIRRMSLVPKHIQDAITVNYGNSPCNTESDITILVFPNTNEYTTNMENVSYNNRYLSTNGILNNEILDSLIQRDFADFEIGIIQCKTNWNDNAQIPMLWDMIYSAGGFSGRNITIGRNNYSIQNCQKFTYSFVTVPSNNGSYFSTNIAVKRVYNLSGGNYWGKQTTPDVCRSLKEIFNNNYANGFNTGGARNSITAVINQFEETGDYSYFKIRG
ncbi:hypothetical protein [Elizabethkingia bruuniana]|uniref:hypothetical protein n=1 Tax=Elizabethkingia bruuniana TaxID=1756149 RepID=UPI0009999D1E|nr:hypothetical protein [Elizabethkingia bruuniana]OPC59297.1 hypothetical protein BAY07_03270 [Elizabethkingia bruuniana]